MTRPVTHALLQNLWSALWPYAGQCSAPCFAVVHSGRTVTAVQIDGVLHEFSSIAGVREDVTDVVLNIKKMALAMQTEGPKRLTLTKKGPASLPQAMLMKSPILTF